MAEEEKEKTAFTTRMGKFEFNVMPFGLKGAVATFCQLIDLVFAGYHWSFVLCYLDDCLIYSINDWSLHLQHLEKAFFRMRHAKVALKLTKCFFGYNEVPYLGHIVGSQGLKMESHRVEAIQRVQKPTTKTEVRAFLGLTGYYRHFIKNYASSIQPLVQLVKKDSPDRNIPWSEKAQQTFEKLKRALSTYPVLQLPLFHQPFFVETDASIQRIAGILMQERDGKKVVIQYFSRICKPAETRYPILELEMLAIVESIKHFRPYLWGRHFTVITYHSAFSYCLKISNPSSRLTRWILTLQECDFEVKWRPGRKNQAADALSRLPTILEFNALEAEQFDNFEQHASLLTKEKLVEAQQQDEFCSLLANYISTGKLPAEKEKIAWIIAWTRHLTMKDQVLYYIFRHRTPGRV